MLQYITANFSSLGLIYAYSTQNFLKIKMTWLPLWHLPKSMNSVSSNTNMLDYICKCLCIINCFGNVTTNMCLTTIKNDCLAFVLHINVSARNTTFMAVSCKDAVMNLVGIITHFTHQIQSSITTKHMKEISMTYSSVC
jgi:hypothetical protein